MSGYYPPGVSSLPYDYDYPCEVCGETEENCICQECEVCGSVGDIDCYINHGLKRTEQQKFYLECNTREWEKEAQAEYEYMKQFENIDIFED